MQDLSIDELPNIEEYNISDEELQYYTFKQLLIEAELSNEEVTRILEQIPKINNKNALNRLLKLKVEVQQRSNNSFIREDNAYNAISNKSTLADQLWLIIEKSKMKHEALAQLKEASENNIFVK